MSLKLDGRNPLAYMGVRPIRASAVILQNRQPTTNDYQNFDLGTWWIIPVDATFTQGEAWILTGKSNNSATWIQLDAGPTSGVVLTLTGDTGGAISPDSSGNIDINGSGSISVAGSGTALTISSAGHSSVTVQVFTSDDTYTPTSGMVSCIVECIGGGGAGGKADTTQLVGSGGGAGGYCRKAFDAATIGASQAVTIGAGGAGNDSTEPANSGADTTFGSLLTGGGGTGGSGASTIEPGGAGGTATNGDINISGQQGFGSYSQQVAAFGGGAVVITRSGAGGSTIYGQGGSNKSASGGGADGYDASGYGGGGGGAVTVGAGNDQAGGDGADGVVIVTEFIS